MADAVTVEPVSVSNSLLTGKRTGNFVRSAPLKHPLPWFKPDGIELCRTNPAKENREFIYSEQGISEREQGIFVSVHFSHTCAVSDEHDLFSPSI